MSMVLYIRRVLRVVFHSAKNNLGKILCVKTHGHTKRNLTVLSFKQLKRQPGWDAFSKLANDAKLERDLIQACLFMLYSKIPMVQRYALV